jgi:hypothetical protein
MAETEATALPGRPPSRLLPGRRPHRLLLVLIRLMMMLPPGRGSGCGRAVKTQVQKRRSMLPLSPLPLISPTLHWIHRCRTVGLFTAEQ